MKMLYFIPIATLIMAVRFWILLFRFYLEKKFRHPYMIWCLVGVFLFALESFTEVYHSLFGWSAVNFRFWYLSGTLLGGALLAQAYVYHLYTRPVANRMGALLMLAIVVSGVAVLFSPIQQTTSAGVLNSDRLAWHWITGIAPFMNAYAIIFMAGGAIWSASNYYKRTETGNLFWANILIATGILLIEIGESFLIIDYHELQYVTDLCGLICLMIAFKMIQLEPQGFPRPDPVTS